MSAADSAQHHREWLSLVSTTGPFLSLPVLRRAWPSLDALDKPTRERLRAEHTVWQDDAVGSQQAWIGYVLRDLLGWGDALHDGQLDELAVPMRDEDTAVTPSFALVEPGQKPAVENFRILGLVTEPGRQPTALIPGQGSATLVDHIAQACRVHNIPLGLVTDGRWWALVYAPVKGATATAVFDAISWPDAAERIVVRAFASLLSRQRFFGVPEAEQPVALFAESKDAPEEITEALGVQVRQAVELLVGAFGRADARLRELGDRGLVGNDDRQLSAHDIYRGAVAVMMRVVFLLFAEERRLLPSDNDIYATAYSAGGLLADLEQQVTEGTEEDLEHNHAAWQRLLALFDAVYHGIDHPQLIMHGHDGSLFDPDRYGWLPLNIDDRTVLHMLRSVQHVVVGTGRSRERRTLSFRTLDVEQIGYVYEGLLSFDGFRAADVTVGLIGKEGHEEEVPLADLETEAARHATIDERASALAERYKESKIGTPAKLAKLLAPLAGVEGEEALKRLLAVTDGNYPLAERLLPFARIIRDDLRSLPVVVLPGALFVTESKLRKMSGTHYTPRKLAEEIVEGALEPLVYELGPLQTADDEQWIPKSSAEILSLKVADIAMGSGAFLVAATRYLAGHLIKARVLEHTEVQPSDVDADDDPVVIKARRAVIEHCIYGVDINPMAVDMAKLSLWLVSMTPELPFTFVDDRLVTGDSLLGITSLEQLEWMHLHPKTGRAIHERSPVDFTAGVRSVVGDVADLRRRIPEIFSGELDPMAAVAQKRRLLAEADDKTEQVRLFADLAVGAALANARRGQGGLRDGSIAAADYARRVREGSEKAFTEAQVQLREWLSSESPQRGEARRPLHWPLTFPEVFEEGTGGFDAIVGNPPFVGGQNITGTMGTAYRELLVQGIARGARGSADLVAYFVLRAQDLLNAFGQTGLIATKTLAEGDTREVGLDQVVVGERAATIRRAIKRRKWPTASANVQFSAIWTSRAPLGKGAAHVADDVVVAGIGPSLDGVSRAPGNPSKLQASVGLSFIGSYILGIGFTMSPQNAQALIANDPRNSEILFPYLIGNDLTSRPDCSASRWVINFHDWPEERAQTYPDCYDQVRRLVKPERDIKKDKSRREFWWRFTRPAPDLYSAISGLSRVIALTRVSKVVLPVIVSTGQVIGETVVVFATDDTAMLALLSSSPHYWWTEDRASKLDTRVRYTPSDVFERLALPPLTPELRVLGNRLDTSRRDVMVARQAGLTSTYNMVFDPRCRDEDIVELRQIHREIDEAACRAWGWDDLVERGLDHGFHQAGVYTRYTVGPVVSGEVVDRLHKLNFERYAQETAAPHDAGRLGSREPALFEVGRESDEPGDDLDEIEESYETE